MQLHPPKLCTLPLILVAAFIWVSCGESPERSPEIAVEDQVQAVLLVQNMDFDPAHKDSISGSYEQKSSMEVPANLAPQNKWVMFEGPVLENDVVAYRIYMDSRHRYDIYAKSVSDLVMDTVGWNYHDIMDWGSDVLKVGSSLGMGSPACWNGDTLYTLSEADRKQVEIVEDTETSATVRFSFEGLRVGAHQFSLQQDWSIQAGSPWSKVCLSVIEGELPEDLSFATGIVNHGLESRQISTASKAMAYTWGKQSFHEENLGMAVAIPGEEELTSLPVPDSHAFLLPTSAEGTCYEFMAAWERGPAAVSTEEEFISLMKK
ncbi:MAG: DUF4861 family protein [Bacteroidota bacterium]